MSRRDDREMREALLPLSASALSSRCPSPAPRHQSRPSPKRVARWIGALGLLAAIVGAALVYWRTDRLMWQSLWTPDVAPGYAGPAPVRCPVGQVELETRLDQALRELESSLRPSPVADRPRTIWTSAKRVDDLLPRVRESWVDLNQADGWRLIVLDDAAAREVVADTFSSERSALSPSTAALLDTILATYDRFDRPVQRVDLLRYVLLWRHGGACSSLAWSAALMRSAGVWTDSDTLCMQPIDSWEPLSWREQAEAHTVLASERA